MSNMHRILAALALGAVASAAQGGVVQVSQSLSLGTLLDGSGQNFMFDLNPALAQHGSGAGRVQSAELILYGYSSADYTRTEQYSYYSLTGSSSRTVMSSYGYYGYPYGYGYPYYGYPYGYYYTTAYDYTYQRTRTINMTDAVQDEMQVTAGASSASAFATTHNTARTSQLNYQYTSGYYDYGYQTYYQLDTTNYSSYGGDLNLTMALDSAALFDINQDGHFSFFVNAPGLSQFTVQQATLNLMALLPESGEVPEPATFGMVGGALGMLALMRRRRSRK